MYVVTEAGCEKWVRLSLNAIGKQGKGVRWFSNVILEAKERLVLSGSFSSCHKDQRHYATQEDDGEDSKRETEEGVKVNIGRSIMDNDEKNARWIKW